MTFVLILFLILPNGQYDRYENAGFKTRKACMDRGIEIAKERGGWDNVRFTCREAK